MTQQPNSVDCGVYALLFAERLLQHYGEYNITARIDRSKKRDELFSFLQFEEKCADDLRTKIQTIVDTFVKNTVQLQSQEESDDSDIEVVGVDIKSKPPVSSLKRKPPNRKLVTMARKAPRILTNRIPPISPFPQFQPNFYPQVTPIFHSVYLTPTFVDPHVNVSPYL